MNINLGSKVWVPSSFKYKKVIEIEKYEDVVILYMDDITSYSSNEVFPSFTEFFIMKVKFFFKNRKKETRIKNEKLLLNVFLSLPQEEIDRIFIECVEEANKTKMK
jgi:hypothetical protein